MEPFSACNNLDKIEILEKYFLGIYHPNLSVRSPVRGQIFLLKKCKFLVLTLNLERSVHFILASTLFLQHLLGYKQIARMVKI